MHIFRLPILVSPFSCTECANSANCFLFVFLKVAVRCLGHIKNKIDWLINVKSAIQPQTATCLSVWDISITWASLLRLPVSKHNHPWVNAQRPVHRTPVHLYILPLCAHLERHTKNSVTTVIAFSDYKLTYTFFFVQFSKKYIKSAILLSQRHHPLSLEADEHVLLTWW